MFEDHTIAYVLTEKSKRVRGVAGYSEKERHPICSILILDYVRHYYLCNFFTSKEYRNKGYATRVLKYVLRKADKPVELTVNFSNKTALNLYKKFKFEEVIPENDDKDEEDEYYEYRSIRMVYKKK
jgi:ribosomal protein S18 acetylase RimI-like enzyme